MRFINSIKPYQQLYTHFKDERVVMALSMLKC